MAGYSGTPLYRKLGIEPGQTICVIGAPMSYAALIGPDAPEVRIVADDHPDTDITHVFVTQRAARISALDQALVSMAHNGMIWVSWPKKSARVPSEVTEDTIRACALPRGLVDVKVCAVDDIWSGLKLVIRKELR